MEKKKKKNNCGRENHQREHYAPSNKGLQMLTTCCNTSLTIMNTTVKPLTPKSVCFLEFQRTLMVEKKKRSVKVLLVGGRLHSLRGQPMPVLSQLDLSFHSETCFPMFRWNFLYFNESPLSLVLSLGITESCAALPANGRLYLS